MKRAIGITRVSAEGDRETVHSYATQAERIQQNCERDGLQLLHIGQERNVSGGANLVNRPELSKAVEAVERGEADVIVAAYFDRFFRSLEVQGEVIRRIEKAGGEVLTLDHGQLTNATPAKRMTANIIGAISQYFREQTGEKVREGHRAAVAAGRLPYSKNPVGYLRQPDKRLAVDPALAPVVREMFERRADGESVHSICRWWNERTGRQNSTTMIRTTLKSRVYLGEIHFGENSNLSAHEPIVSRELWDRAQRGTGKPGRPPLGEPRLLARLGIVRCHCGHRMSVAGYWHDLPLAGKRRYYTYRCAANPGHRPSTSIKASVVEDFVVRTVRDALRDAQGHASIAESHRNASLSLSGAQNDLDIALRVFSLTGAENEPAAVERILELRRARDAAQAKLDRTSPNVPSLVIRLGEDWDRLTITERRDVIPAYVESVTILPATIYGRGSRPEERITVQLLGEYASGGAV